MDTLQVNIGYKCNQQCLHCHVNAGPNRTEMMGEENIDLIIQVLRKRRIACLDITGGAPELHPNFKKLVVAARSLGVRVIDRCNLTIIFEQGYEDLPEFLAQNQVEIIASLPCYSIENVDRQRGNGVFDKSIKALQLLNKLGYGDTKTNLIINLVYNPQGPVLPPDQQALEADYKRELLNNFGIVFNNLYALANMPIKRFGSVLVSKKQFAPYMDLLIQNHSDANIDNVMCRNLISVDWQGYLYDCDFNQQLGLKIKTSVAPHLADLLESDFSDSEINVSGHCFACTAGSGSSCGGALK